MSVYVDKPMWPYLNMIMCHMVADDLEELHAMADAIGVKRKWFQDGRLPHYDISKTKRETAIKLGAIDSDAKTIVLKSRWLRVQMDQPKYDYRKVCF